MSQPQRRKQKDMTYFGLLSETSELRVFASVVAHGSFAKAADEHQMTPSGVSKLIARLEERLGARLLQRTTRKLSLTEVGAGVGLHPNSVRLLRRLGLGAELEHYGARQVDRQFWRADGTFIGPAWSPDQARAIESYGMHRADLLGMLVDRLPRDVVTLGHRCVGFEQDDERATVVFANGERATADVVVAADQVGRNPRVAPGIAGCQRRRHRGRRRPA